MSISRDRKFRSLVLALGPCGGSPWWWDEVRADPGLCEMTYKRVSVRNKRSRQIRTYELPWLFLKLLFVLLRARSRYEYVFTFENDFTSFAVAFWQSVLFLRRPKHVILLFIMREKTEKLSSRVKYLLMKALFVSVRKVICSARVEADYYIEAFAWPRDKVGFARLPAVRELLDQPTRDTEGFLFSGGRVYRDYETLAQAIAGSAYRTIVVASSEPPSLRGYPHVEFMQDIPVEEFNALLARSRVVVLPLEDKRFSVGQTVVLQAMAMGKPVITTRTAGTLDYVEDMKTGILVEPGDAAGLRGAIDMLMGDADLRASLGRRARQAVRQAYLPEHFTQAVRSLLRA